MAEAHYLRFIDKVRQLNSFVAMGEADPELRRRLIACDHHDQVVALAREYGLEIGRRWGEPVAQGTPHDGPESDSATLAASLLASARQADLNRSLLAGPCPAQGEERTEVLLQTTHWRLERIHSCAAVSPEGFWYDQSEHEWVSLLQGSAALRFADEPQERRLCAGDSLLIRAGQRHRLTQSDPAPGTIWLALFWQPA